MIIRFPLGKSFFSQSNFFTIDTKSKALLLQSLNSTRTHCLFRRWVRRDTLLEKEPKDFDIATSASPDEVLQLFPNADSIGAIWSDSCERHGEGFGVATFRHDGSYSDGAILMSPPQDLRRTLFEDFTINGLFKNPVTNELVDFVHGVADLEERISNNWSTRSKVSRGCIETSPSYPLCHGFGV